jgi:hypothetical protein
MSILVALCALADSPGGLGGGRQMEDDFDRLMTIEEKEHPGVTVVRQVAAGPPRSALLAAAAEAQLLVVGSGGLGGLDGIASARLSRPSCTIHRVRSQSSTRTYASADPAAVAARLSPGQVTSRVLSSRRPSRPWRPVPGLTRREYLAWAR